MLKFLEEPDGQVLGFFITSNKDNILLTIQSRCQLIKVDYQMDNQNDYFGLNIEEYQEILNSLKEYVQSIEEKNTTAILNNKKIMLAQIVDKVKIEIIFNIILDIYKNALYYKYGFIETFSKYKEFNFVLNNSSDILQKKLNLLIEFVNNLNYNLNSELMLDKFVLEMGGISE